MKKTTATAEEVRAAFCVESIGDALRKDGEALDEAQTPEALRRLLRVLEKHIRQDTPPEDHDVELVRLAYRAGFLCCSEALMQAAADAFGQLFPDN